MKQRKEDLDSMISDHDFWESILDGLDEAFVIAQPDNIINSSDLCEISPDRSWPAAEQQPEFQDHGKKMLGNDCELVPALSNPWDVLEPAKGCTHKEHRHAQANRNLVPTNEVCTNSDFKLTEAVGNLKVEGNAHLIERTPELSPLIFQNLDFCSLPSPSPLKGDIPSLPPLNLMTEGLDPQMWNTNPEASISCHGHNIMGMIRAREHAGQVNEALMIEGGGPPDQLASNVDERMGGGLCWNQLQVYCQNSSDHYKLLSIPCNLIGGMISKHYCEDQAGPSSSSWSGINELSESRPMNATRKAAALPLPLHQRSEPVDRNNTDISYSELSQYFNMPIAQAARELKVGLTVLKKKCREFGIPRWPHRKMKSLETLIHNIQELAKSNGGLSQARLSDAIQVLEEQKKLMEESPGTELAERTKRLRQACFKANYKKRRQMICAGQIANHNNDTSSSSNQVIIFPPQPSNCSSIPGSSGSNTSSS